MVTETRDDEYSEELPPSALTDEQAYAELSFLIDEVLHHDSLRGQLLRRIHAIQKSHPRILSPQVLSLL